MSGPLAKVFSSVAKRAFYVSEVLFWFFCEWFSCFVLTSDSGKKNISFEKKFRHFCWNCILSVPRTFWWVFIKNVLVFQFSLVFQAKFIELLAEIFQQSSKMHFERTHRTLVKLINRIVKNAFYVSRGTLWRKHCWPLETNSTFGRKFFGFAAEKLQDCCHMSTICFQMAN